MLDDLPALAAFVPGPEVMEALEAGLRVTPDDPSLIGGEEDDAGDGDIEPDSGSGAVDLRDE